MEEQVLWFLRARLGGASAQMPWRKGADELAGQSSSLSQGNAEILGSGRIWTTMKKRLGPELGVNLSLPFLTKIHNALRSEQLLDLDLIRWKEGSGLSPPAQPRSNRHFHHQTFISLSPPSQAFAGRGEASPRGWNLAHGVWAAAPGRMMELLKGGIWRDYSIAGRPQPGDSYRRQSLWSQWDWKACKSVWNLVFSWKSVGGYLFYLHINYF